MPALSRDPEGAVYHTTADPLASSYGSVTALSPGFSACVQRRFEKTVARRGICHFPSGDQLR
jgi:hypothetical protein